MPAQRSGRLRKRAAKRRSTRTGAKGKSPGRKLLGKRGWVFRIALGLLVVWLIGCLVVIVEPTVNKPAKVDAILVLGPPDVDGRVTAAYALARAHYAATVVISVTSALQFQRKSACRNDNPQYQVICFQPHPATTQGEAREIGQLAREHHWKSIIVVTS
ncbi:MAG: YdcF family protein, partial [Jatrophihabitantaceae bacterium]